MARLLVTTALPYANGALHLGHLLECIQADVWVRFKKLQGDHCIFVSGEDAHGTPIMLSAKKKGLIPEEFVAQMQVEHQRDYHDFDIDFSNFHTTHSEENRLLVEAFFRQAQAKQDIITLQIEQAYDAKEKMFLPDRFIKGCCPKCRMPDQYGDHCEKCGAIYAPTDLTQAYSVLSGTEPIRKTSEHYFFCLDRYEPELKIWLQSGQLQSSVCRKLNEWLQAGLKKWDISRDAPYFGLTIPGTTDKYFYVWLDAPVGYMASFKHLCQQKTDLLFDDYWRKDSDVQLYHFIGKDIIYFHALFWPAMLMSADFRLPTGVFAHGFLNVKGHKMSKSRGTFMTARHYLNHLDPEYLRYYFATKLNAGIDDIDLEWVDFMQRINTDLVGKLVNIASRCAHFIERDFDCRLSDQLSQPVLYQEFVAAGSLIAQNYAAREFSKAMRQIMQLADRANQYIDQHQPWKIAKKKSDDPRVQMICSMGLNLFRVLILYLKPVLPKLAMRSEALLNDSLQTWLDCETPLTAHVIQPFKPLMCRVTRQQIDCLLED